MEFQKFPSLTNHYMEKDIQWALDHGFPSRGHFVVTEKLHGANFSIWVSKDEIRFAKRTSFVGHMMNAELIEDDNYNPASMFVVTESLYNWERLFQNVNFNAMLKIIVHNCRERINDDEVIAVYGELHGSNIQKEVYYGKDIQFAAYDAHKFVDGKRFVLSWDEFLTIMANNGNFVVPYIDERDDVELQELLDMDIKLQSRKTPEDYEGDNIMEGVVIRLAKGYEVPTDSSPFVIKKKNPQFLENKRKKKAEVKNDTIPDHMKEILEIASGYVNENRLNALFSKLGELQQMRDFGMYIKAFNEDWQTDFVQENGDNPLFVSLSDKDKKNLFSRVNHQATSLLKKQIMGK